MSLLLLAGSVCQHSGSHHTDDATHARVAGNLLVQSAVQFHVILWQSYPLAFSVNPLQGLLCWLPALGFVANPTPVDLALQSQWLYRLQVAY